MRHGARVVAIALSVSIVASVWFAAAYALHFGPLGQGAGLCIVLAALGTALFVWALRLLPQRHIVDVSDDFPSSPVIPREADEELRAGYGELAGSGFLMRFFDGALGALGLASLFPLRSLAPRFGEGLYSTKWTGRFARGRGGRQTLQNV